jgi:dTDP-4-dehydrorhamnose reductase
MKILVTGANGMLGTDLVPILKGEGHDIIATDLEEMDITVPDKIKEVVISERPEIIMNCAAYTQVDKAEQEPDKAFLINGRGTENIALVCREFGIDLCYISTDYVFNGEKKIPYAPDDKTDPINTYGASKLAGENAIRKTWDRHYIVRTSWLYGKNGKNFVHSILDLAKNQDEIKVVDDQIGSPTWTVSLAHALSKIIMTGKFGIYHVTDETDGGISWHRFAEEIVGFAHLDCRVNPVKSSEFPRPAKRPKNSVLDVAAAKMILGAEFSPWEKSLKEYLSTLDPGQK